MDLRVKNPGRWQSPRGIPELQAESQGICQIFMLHRKGAKKASGKPLEPKQRFGSLIARGLITLMTGQGGASLR